MNKKLENLLKNQKFDQKEIFKITSSRELSKNEHSILEKLVQGNLAKSVKITFNSKLSRHLIKFEVALVDVQKVKEKLSFIDFSSRKVKDQ